MYVILDDNGFYTGNYFDYYVGVGEYVETLPPFPLDDKKQRSHKLVDGIWAFSEERYKELCEEEEPKQEISLEEKLNTLVNRQEELKIVVEDNQAAIYAIVEVMMEGDE